MLCLHRPGKEEVASRNMFIGGCESKRLESIKKHDISGNHKLAIAMKEGQNKSKETVAYKTLTSLNASVEAVLHKLFLTCHAVGMKYRPYTDYAWICQLDKAKGTDVGDTYLTDDYGKIFMGFI